MLTFEQAEQQARELSQKSARPQHVNRYFYHNPMTRERELRFVVVDQYRPTKTVLTYHHGKRAP